MTAAAIQLVNHQSISLAAFQNSVRVRPVQFREYFRRLKCFLTFCVSRVQLFSAFACWTIPLCQVTLFELVVRDNPFVFPGGFVPFVTF